MPAHMLATENRNPRPMLRQNSSGVCSQRTKRWLTVGDVGSAKYGKSVVEKNLFRAMDDIRKVAKGHYTTIRIARNATPPKTACCHLGASLNIGKSKSRKNAGTISNRGNGSGTMWVMS